MNDPTLFAEAFAALRKRLESLRAAADADPELRAATEARLAEVIAAEGRRQRETVLEHAAVPRRLWAALDSLEETDAMRALAAWRRGGKTFLVLEGGVGVGKTVAAASFAARPGGLFRKAADVARLSSFDAATWDMLYRSPALALDDLGAESLDEKGWARNAILGLLDRRYDDAAPTVITTNLGIESFRERYGQDGGRLFDRLKEAAEWVAIGGASMRRAAP